MTRQVEPKDYTGQAAVLTHLRVAKSLDTRKAVRIGKRLKETVGKLFLLGEEEPRLLLSLVGSPKLELFRFSEGKQLEKEEFVSHRSVRR